ncbi:putative baseplate assembly protein [Halomicrobium katesii]|uniref:putative baseplate assembly protein n=1 Tax=Halomicrobium katesii TaxID=437163 RepID=UPI0003641FD9|nr:putative baseplate assembly protein [Halomicrobium katesii]
MGLDLPELDDREHEELLEQAKKLIPAYSENWTDFNPHDPGITILEVLAWLTETHTYQLDQITDEHRKKYLQLVGHRPHPPEPATASIRVDPPRSMIGKRIAAGSRLAVTEGTDTLYQFETDRDLVLVPESLDEIVTVDEFGSSVHTDANGNDEMHYLPFGKNSSRGNSLYIGFDTDPFLESDRLTLHVAYHDDNLPEPAPATDGELTFDPSVELAWEYNDASDDRWCTLEVVRDGTNQFYESGLLELELVDSRIHDGRLPDRLSPDRHWIRCRIRTPGHEIPPQVDAIRTNVVTASHAASVTTERLVPAGDATDYRTTPVLNDQTYAFENQPILSAEVYVDGELFRGVENFDASSPEDPHYVLDRELGQVTFGDGTHGRVPAPDATITADYVYGGGEQGNVSANSAWRFTDLKGKVDESDGELDVFPLESATGGRDAESIEAALRRARRDLQKPYRAVTMDDYRYITANTPGLRIGRTGVWHNDGHTTVIVVPYAPPDVNSPEPSDAFLDAVRDHLLERTLLADQVTVSGPRYVRLELTVTGTIRPEFARSGYESAVTDAITSHLHPLTGFDGNGWPFGRKLIVEELKEQITTVDAVDHLSNLDITAHGGTVVDGTEVLVDETALFSIADITINMTPARRE